MKAWCADVVRRVRSLATRRFRSLVYVNRSRLLENALEALLAQVPDAPTYEVVVVDNNSDDDTRDVVEPFVARGVVRYEFEPRQGLSVARNHGVSVSRADLIAFTDDDVRVSSTWIRSIAQAFGENPDGDMVGGKIEPVWEEHRRRGSGRPGTRHWRSSTSERAHFVSARSGPCASLAPTLP